MVNHAAFTNHAKHPVPWIRYQGNLYNSGYITAFICGRRQMMINEHMRILFIALIVFIFSGTVLAESNVARVAFLRGAVTATDEATGVPRLLQRDSRVEVGEVISTGPKALAQLVFPDNSMLYIKSDSVVKLEEFHYSKEEPEKDSAVTNVFKGSMRALTGIVGKRSKDKVKYKTRVSTVGIRGTALEIWQDGDAVTVDFGDVVIENSGGPKLLKAGESAKTSSSNKQASLFDYQRPDGDSAVLAKNLVTTKPEDVVARSEEICTQLNTEDALLLMAMQGQVPGFTPRVATSTIKGLMICLPVDQIALLLTTSVLIYPDLASGFLRSAVGDKVNVAIALEAVLRGMEDPGKDRLNIVVNEAIQLGLTPAAAKGVTEAIKNRGICK